MGDVTEPAFKGMKQEPEESGVKWNDLPDLSFELVLSFLSLEDLIKSRAVSRQWYQRINSFRVKNLCFSKYPTSYVQKSCRMVTAALASNFINGVFTQNFICLRRFEPFFQTFGQSILSSLKHLVLYGLDLNQNNAPVLFFQTLNLFKQLKELGLFHIDCSTKLGTNFQLNLPMLKSVTLVKMCQIEKLTLNAPKLQNVKLVSEVSADLRLDIVYGDSIEKLIIERMQQIEVAKLKNLKYLYCGYHSRWSRIDSTLLSTLEQLKEVHLQAESMVTDFFEQKARHGRTLLKIFLCGCLLNGPNDPLIGSLDDRNRGYLRLLVENPTRLATEIPLNGGDLLFSAIEKVAPEKEMDLLNRFTDLKSISGFEPVQDVERFLGLLKRLNHIVALGFVYEQQQQLFDRLPDHLSAIWKLEIHRPPKDLNFVLKLKNLMALRLSFQIEIDFTLKVFEELPLLSSFCFNRPKYDFLIKIDHYNQFKIYIGGSNGETFVSDLDAAIEWIREKEL